MKRKKKIIAFILLCVALIALIATVVIEIKQTSKIDDAALIKPLSVITEPTTNKNNLTALIRAAELYYTFWNTGEYKYLEAVIAPNFIDRTLPKGRPQGVIGIKTSVDLLRNAIPNLQCSIESLIVTGNMITARLRFKGTSTGEYLGHPATGKPVEFIAIDILQINNNRLTEAWHVQDDLSLLEQLNIVTVR